MITFKNVGERNRYVAEHAWESAQTTLQRRRGKDQFVKTLWDKLDIMVQYEITEDAIAVLSGSHLVSGYLDHDIAFSTAVVTLGNVTQVEP